MGATSALKKVVRSLVTPIAESRRGFSCTQHNHARRTNPESRPTKAELTLISGRPGPTRVPTPPAPAGQEQWPGSGTRQPLPPPSPVCNRVQRGNRGIQKVTLCWDRGYSRGPPVIGCNGVIGVSKKSHWDRGYIAGVSIPEKLKTTRLPRYNSHRRKL